MIQALGGSIQRLNKGVTAHAPGSPARIVVQHQRAQAGQPRRGPQHAQPQAVGGPAGLLRVRRERQRRQMLQGRSSSR